MKVVILAGGLGSRLTEETTVRPKPMLEIGGKPLLWHIMKIYSHHGLTDFIVCLGYKGYVIKEYFANYFLHMSDVTINLQNNQVTVHQNHVRALDGHSRRDRGHDADRWAAASRATAYRRQRSALPMETGSATST